MSAVAFHSRPELRDLALRRLEEQAADGGFAGGPFSREQGHWSPAACIIQGTDAADLPAQLGLPAWLGYAMESVCSGLEGAEALAFCRELFAQLPPGTIIRWQGSAVCALFLDDLLATPGLEEGLSTAIGALRQLHRAAATGQSVPPTAWRAARRAACQATDRQGDPVGQSIGACAESAAWDPEGSITVVASLIDGWKTLQFVLSDAAADWTPAKARALDDAFASIDRELTPTLETFDQARIHAAFLERHPDLAAEFHRTNERRARAAPQFAARSAQLVLQALGSRACSHYVDGAR